MGSLYFWALEATLEDLVAAAQAESRNDSVAMNEIVRRFEPKALMMASFLTKDYHLRQDIANDARYGVVLAVRAHTPGTAGVASYIAATMRGEAYRAIGRYTETHTVVHPDDAPAWSLPNTAVEHELVVDSDLALLAEDLSEDQRVLVFKRYVMSEQMRDIATADGISVSAISQRFKTVHKIVELTAGRLGLKVA